jgi:hypothetical protein
MAVRVGTVIHDGSSSRDAPHPSAPALPRPLCVALRQVMLKMERWIAEHRQVGLPVDGEREGRWR